MALKAYTLDLALQTSSEFAIGNTIPNVAGIATDGKGFIPTKNSINKTITLSKGFGKFGGRLFEMTEQTVYSWDSGSADADAYLVIDLTKQNSFTGTIEDGTYNFVDNQSSIVVSSTQPEPSANTLVYKLDGNYNTFTSPIDGSLKTREAKFTDFATVANDMFAYAGNWFTKPSAPVANSPYRNAWGVVEVIPGDAKGSGRIIFTPYDPGDGNIYYNSVSWKGLGTWLKVANDSEVLHKTGNETAAGDKTFDGKITMNNTLHTTGVSGTVKMWYSANISYAKTGRLVQLLHNGGNTAQIKSNSISVEKLPAFLRPAVAAAMPAHPVTGAKIAVNPDGTFKVTEGDVPVNFYGSTVTYIASDSNLA